MVQGICQIEKAYKMTKGHDFADVTFDHGHFRMIKNTYDNNNEFNVKYELIHYGTLILTVTFDFTHGNIEINNGHGFSQTDRNNINALLQVLNIYFVNASIKNGCLMLNFQGLRTNNVIQKML